MDTESEREANAEERERKGSRLESANVKKGTGRSVVGSVSVLGIEGHRFEPYRSESLLECGQKGRRLFLVQ